MNNRKRNLRFVQISSQYAYCLSDALVATLLDGSVLTSVLSPPPPPLSTSPLNITTHYDKTTLRVLVVLQLLCPHVHFGSLRAFVVTFGFM